MCVCVYMYVWCDTIRLFVAILTYQAIYIELESLESAQKKQQEAIFSLEEQTIEHWDRLSTYIQNSVIAQEKKVWKVVVVLGINLKIHTYIHIHTYTYIDKCNHTH